jgi:hypothetical protein
MIPFKDMDRMLSFGSKRAQRRAQGRVQLSDPGRNRLPPEASITLAAEREATGVDDILASLDQ